MTVTGVPRPTTAPTGSVIVAPVTGTVTAVGAAAALAITENVFALTLTLSTTAETTAKAELAPVMPAIVMTSPATRLCVACAV